MAKILNKQILSNKFFSKNIWLRTLLVKIVGKKNVGKKVCSLKKYCKQIFVNINFTQFFSSSTNKSFYAP